MTMRPALQLLATLACTSVQVRSAAPKRNVMYIVIDDLRPELGAYQAENTLTPNLDQLAKESVVFDRAYVQVALCGPSRNSFMTGRRPDVTRVFDFADHFREIGVGDTWQSLPQIFKADGHLSLATGKLYHPNLPPNYDGDNSWSPECLDWNYNATCRELGNPSLGSCSGPEFNPVELNGCGNPGPYPAAPLVPPTNYSPALTPGETGGVKRFTAASMKGGFGGLTYCGNIPYQDLNITARAESYMKLAAASGKAFFLGVGLHKPHLPFQAPPEYFEKFPVEDVSLPAYKTFPKNAPSIAFHDTTDSPSPWIPLPDWKLRETRRAYKAAISFMDHHIGTLRTALTAAGHAEDTAILYHADHGWQLGEHAMWRKMSCFELATRVPFILHVPWLKETAGTRSKQLVELVDVLPTLLELGGVPMPTNETYDGVSLVPLVDGTAKSTGKNMSFSQYARGYAARETPPPYPPTNLSDLWALDNAGHFPRSTFYAMGHSVRTEQWRYTEWVHWDASADNPDWSQPLLGRELYDHTVSSGGEADFDSFENENLVDAEEHRALVKQLSGALRYFFIEAQCRQTLCPKAERLKALGAQGITLDQ